MAAAKVSIISINYNNLEVTKEFLRSLRKSNFKDFEVILVDNASKQDPTEEISKEFPEVKLIVSDKNLGFAGGNNLGIRKAEGDYLFLVNNDTEVSEDLLDQLLISIESDEKIGVVCPKIMYFSNPEMIQYAGFTKINPYTGRNKAIGNKEIDHGQFDESKTTHYAHGAAMLVKKEIIEKVGPMPEEFFLYYEELDWSSSISKAGYKIFFEPKAVIYHKESVSIGASNPIKTYFLNRNRVLFMRRNSSKAELVLFTIFLFLITIPKNTLVYLITGQIQQLKSFISGIMWNFKPKGNLSA